MKMFKLVENLFVQNKMSTLGLGLASNLIFNLDGSARVQNMFEFNYNYLLNLLKSDEDLKNFLQSF
jgi:hypothetical protein